MAGIRLDVATIVQGYWKEVGVETEIEPVEAAIIVERMVKGEYDFYVGGAAALLPFDLLRFRSGSPSPVAFGYSNPKVDEIVAQIGDTFDHEALAAALLSTAATYLGRRGHHAHRQPHGAGGQEPEAAHRAADHQQQPSHRHLVASVGDRRIGRLEGRETGPRGGAAESEKEREPFQ